MTTAVNDVYQAIRKAILAGVYQPGMHLKEGSLATELGVSRTPVREALRRLGAEGLVAFAPNHGTRVATWDPGAIGEIFEVRAMLESYCASLAAQKITPEQVEELRDLATGMEELLRSGDQGMYDKLADLNSRFHTTILDATNNQFLRSILPSMIDMPLILKTYRRYSYEHLERTCQHHREIIEALACHDDKWAGAIMRLHLLVARANYLFDTSGGHVEKENTGDGNATGSSS